MEASIRVRMIDEASPNAAKIAAATDKLNAAQLRSAQAAQVVAAAELKASEAAVRAATGTEELAAAELRAGRAAERLARAELAASRATERMAASARESSAATAAIGEQAPTAARGLFNVSQESRAAGFAMAGQVNAVAELAYNFGNLSPVTRQLGTAFVMAGGNAFAFAGMLGPVGVALGVAVGVIPGVIDMVRHLGDGFEEAGQKASGFTSNIDELMAAQRRMRRLDELASGEADLEEIQAGEVQARNLLSQAQGQQRSILGAASAGDRAILEAAMASENFSAQGLGFEELRGMVEQQMRADAAREGRSVNEEGLARVTAQRAARISGRVDELGLLEFGSFDAGGPDRAASSGVRAARAQLSQLAEGRKVAEGRAARARQEDAYAETQSQTTAVRDQLTRQVQGLGLGERQSQRLLSEAMGEGSISARALRGVGAGERENIRAAAERFRQLEELGAREADALRAPTLDAVSKRFDGLLGEGVDASTLPTVGISAEGRSGRSATESRYVAARSDAPGGKELTAAAREHSQSAQELERAAKSLDRAAATMGRLFGGGAVDTGPGPLGDRRGR